MNTNRSILGVTVCLAMAFCLNGVQGGEPVSVDLLSDDGTRSVLHYEFSGYQSRNVEIAGAHYQEIWIDSEPVSLEQGAPGLPHLNRSLIIPDNAEMAVRVLDSEYYEIFAQIAPSKGNLSRKVDPATLPYEFGAAYELSAFYPGPLVTLHDPYILRDYRGIVVQVNPFQYNPVTKVLRVYTEMTVEVIASGPGQVNVFDRKAGSTTSSSSFNDLYNPHFLNFSTRAGEKDYDEEGEMLIICNDAWIANMAPFVAHKASVGINATVVGISTIGNTTSAIHNYIQSVYNSSDLAYVLLVGDISQITSPDVYAGEDGASDPSYAKLAGSDNYPDILIGRFSAGSAAEVDTQVERSIDYETLPATTQDWFWRGVGIASDEGAGQGDEGQSDIQHENEIRGWLLGAGYTAVDQIYDPGATDNEVAAALNAGRGIVNYTGHGYSGGWSTTGFNSTDVNNLNNSGKLPFVISVACNNGEFENFTSCYAETWMRATDGGAPSGAAAIYASSVSQYWAPPMEGQDEINLLLTDPAARYHTFGGLCFGGSVSMMDDYGSSGVDMFNTWIIFGDPSLQVVGVPSSPTGLKVEPSAGASAAGPAGGPVTPDSLQYTLINQDAEPLSYEVSCVEPWLSADKASGTIPGGGSEVVTVTLNDHACNLDNGQHSGFVQFTNMSRHEGDTQRTVSLEVGEEVLRHSWTFDSQPGWSTDGEWQFGTPAGSGGTQYGNPDPDSAATGDDVYGVNLNGDFMPLPGGPYYLKSTPFDLTGGGRATLKFMRWLNTQADPPMAHTLEISTDGSSWDQIWTNGDAITDDAWSLQEYDISELAANHSSVEVRWSYNVSIMTSKVSGWNIDDVEVWSIPESIKINLLVESGELLWTDVPGALSYDVVSGDLAALRDSAGNFTLATDSCVENDLSATTTAYVANLGAGEGRWYLVRANTQAGPATYQSLAGLQSGLRDNEINAAGSACP